MCLPGLRHGALLSADTAGSSEQEGASVLFRGPRGRRFELRGPSGLTFGSCLVVQRQPATDSAETDGHVREPIVLYPLKTGRGLHVVLRPVPGYPSQEIGSWLYRGQKGFP